jgi:putative ABC transport system permease protein
VIGIATIVALLSIIETMRRDIEERLDRFGANIVMVPKSDNLTLSYGGIQVGGVNYKTVEFAERRIKEIRTIKNRKNLGIVAPKVLGAWSIDDKKVLLMGADLESELALKTWWQFKGVPPTREDHLIIGSQASTSLGLELGDTVDLGGRTFTISTQLLSTGGPEDAIIIGDLHRMQEVLGKEDLISMVEISAFCRGCPISELTLQIAEKFPDARVTALKQAVMAKMQSIDILRTFSYGIAGIVSVIGSLLVLITMMGSVNERTREIGIFRAIGFRRGHVMQVILMEAMMVGFLGGLLGFIIGNAIAWGAAPLTIKQGGYAGISPILGGLSITGAVILSLLASVYPALKASRLDPSVALRAL